MVKKIYIVGASRSGTTLMGKCISLGGKMILLSETHFFEGIINPDSNISPDELEPILYKVWNNAKYGPVANKTIDTPPKEFLELAKLNILNPYLLFDTMLGKMAELNKNSNGVIEQTPRNIFFANEILRFCPSSYILIMHRSPWSVIRSQKCKWRRRFLSSSPAHYTWPETMRLWANYNPLLMSLQWKSSIARGKSLSGRHVHSIKYEDFVRNPTNTKLEVAKFLGVSISDDWFNPPIEGSSHTIDVNSKIGIQKLDQSTSQSLKPWEKRIIHHVAKKEIEGLNYSINEFGSPSFFDWANCIFRIIFKLPLIIILNANRATSLKNYIANRLKFI